MAISINPLVSPRIITVLAPATDITMQELVNQVRDWEDEQIDMEYAHLIDASGKQPLGGGVLVGITVTLRNAQLAFEARPGPTYVQCNATGGNLVAFDDLGNLIPAIYTTAFTQVVLTSSSSATLQEVSAIQFASFEGCVTIDPVGGSPGTTYPIGTTESPVNNLTDAVTIAVSRGFTKLRFLTDFTFPTGTYLDGYTLIGQGIAGTTFTFDPGSIFVDCEAENAKLTGTVIGIATMRDVHISDLTGASPIPASNPVFIKDSQLSGTFTLPALYSGTVQVVNCWSSAGGCIVDCNGSDAVLSVTGFEGLFTLTNNTNNAVLSLDMDSGKIVLDSSCTSGTYVVRGVGEIVDNSTGTAVVDVSGLVTPRETQYASFEGAIHIDAINGKPGTSFPCGNASNPVDNLADALTISGNLNLKVLMVHSDLTIPTGTVLDEFEVRADKWPSLTIEAGVEQENTVYQKFSLYGEMGGFWNTLIDCWVYDVTNLCGWMRGGSMVSVALAPYTVESSGQSFFDDVTPMYPGVTSTVIMNTDTSVSFTNCKDVVTIESLTTGCNVDCILSGGQLIIDASCTGGDITVTGVGLLDNNSTLTVDTRGLVSAELVQTASFDGYVSLNVVSGSAGTAFPLGNTENPVNNLADAKAIALSRGIKTIKVFGDLTIGASDVIDSLTLEGTGVGQTALTLTSGCSTNNSAFRDMTVSGEQNGETYYESCEIVELYNVHCHFEGCRIIGPLHTSTGISDILVIRGCYSSGVADAPLVFDMNSSSISAAINAFTGSLHIQNFNKDPGAGAITINMQSGKVLIDSSCTKGSIYIRGVCEITNNATGTTVDVAGAVETVAVDRTNKNATLIPATL